MRALNRLRWPLLLVVIVVTYALHPQIVDRFSPQVTAQLDRAHAVRQARKYRDFAPSRFDAFGEEGIYSPGFSRRLDDALRNWADRRRTREDSRIGLMDTQRIYQTGAEPQLNERQRTWTSMNPTWDYVYITNLTAYVDEMYADVPAIAWLFRSLSMTILQVDLYRLLRVYAEGGLYTDLDTKCLKPVDKWLIGVDLDGVELVSGIEVDGFFSSRRRSEYGFTNAMQLVQWTIWGRKYSPVLREAIVLAFGRFVRLAEHDLPRRSLEGLQTTYLSNVDILTTTGPGLLTDAIERHIQVNLRQASWSLATDAHNLTTPIRFGDIVILPVTAWAPNSPHSGARDETDPMAMLARTADDLLLLTYADAWEHSWHNQDTFRYAEDFDEEELLEEAGRALDNVQLPEFKLDDVV